MGILSIVLVLIGLSLNAQELKYRRSSLYSVLIRHPEKEFGKDIDTVFKMMPISDKFNDHNLKVRAINAALAQKNDLTKEENVINNTIIPFLEKNDIGKRLISKWFQRKEGKGKDGTFDMNLIMERGLYDADYYDYQMASRSIRGQSLLMDAGEELIGNTFVLFNDIRYLDKEESSALISAGIYLAGALAAQFTAGLSGLIVDAGAQSLSGITEKIAGFRVSITSYLFRLDWNEENSSIFYRDYFISESDENKRIEYERVKNLFNLQYIGCHTVVSDAMTLRGVKSKNDMIRKVCERAMDKNIAKLQKQYEVFRVKTPLFSTSPLSAKIGLKEDLNEDSRFEVLEAVENDRGCIEYKRVGVVKPIKGKIWDNRYMAEFEEENIGNERTETEFEKISGSDFYPGMLLREI